MKKLLSVVLALALLLSGIVLANAEDEITLTYAAIENVELTKALAAQYEAAHPGIHVNVLELDTATYDTALANLASTQSLPDVFWTGNVCDAIANKWVINLDRFYQEDADAQTISPAIRRFSAIGGKMFCFPATAKPTMVILNKTLFEKYNVELPEYTWTLDEFKALAEELAHPEVYEFGVASSENFDQYLGTHYGWDGESYAFGEDWIDLMDMSYQWVVNGVAEKMTGEEKLAVVGDEGANMFDRGYVAIVVKAAKYAQGYLDGSIAEASGCEFLFYPLPSTDLASDEVEMQYGCIAASCQYPSEAWELGKWMTWGKEATLLRQDFMSKQDELYLDAPMIVDNEVWADMVAKAPEAMQGFYGNMEPVRPDIFPTAPNCLWMNVGYYFGGVHAMFVNGETTPADYAPTMRQTGIEQLSSWTGWDIVNAD